jgi:hypothetical protein
MKWTKRITLDPNVCKGRACVTGTRIMVSAGMKFKIDQNLPSLWIVEEGKIRNRGGAVA